MVSSTTQRTPTRAFPFTNKPGSSTRNCNKRSAQALKANRDYEDSWRERANSHVIPTVQMKEESGRSSLKSCVRMASLGLSLLSRRKRFRRDPDGRSRCLSSPGTRSCRRRRDPCSAWHPSVCRPKTRCASDPPPNTRAPLRRCSPTTSARRPKAFTANHSVCSCSSPPLSFHRSVMATENCAMAVPCWLYFTSGSRPRFPINITFCIFCCSFVGLPIT